MKQIYIGHKQRSELQTVYRKTIRPLHIVQIIIFALLILIPVTFKTAIFHSQGNMSPVAYIETYEGTGSAIYIGNNKLLTAAHVVATMQLNDVCEVVFQDPNNPDGIPVLAKAEVMAKGNWNAVTQDPNQDYALLHIITLDASNYVTSCSIGSSANSKVKDEITVEGYPAGVYMATDGIISSLAATDVYKNLYTVDAKAWHGNSGGALFDKNGHLLGVVTMVGNLKGLNDDQTYVLKIDYIKGQLSSKGQQIP